MEKKTMYTCAICNTGHESVAERAKCENACLAKLDMAVKKAEKEQKKKEQESRRQEVTTAIKHASDLLEAYMDDYGSFSYSSADIEEQTVDTPINQPTEQTVSESEDTSTAKWPFDWFPKCWHYFW